MEIDNNLYVNNNFDQLSFFFYRLEANLTIIIILEYFNDTQVISF